ncbi:uncharacterized protein LTR77_008460 [Saxophila tyrrhenica]|uniref:2-dehydropantoate 2-reductase n=1 Tax=Saxophila tyrrhenica TaxID=1690608 RepID=A0AAV9P2Y3_9PEZI|nr:hypothetical protein LTR77_008460 [Saxophila tyrrhenica]
MHHGDLIGADQGLAGTKMTKALIYGTGGVGSCYGYILDKGGATVTAVCRTNYSAVRESGITIRSKLWGECHFKPHAVQSVKEATADGPFDYIIVASKAFPGTAELIKEAVTPEHTAIVLAQNGIAIEEDYAKLYPFNTIISGVVYLPVTQVQPGVVEMGPLERFEIGPYPANSSSTANALAQRLSDLWKAGGANAPVFDDVQPVRWFKVAINASWNPICALTLCDDANYLRSSNNSEAMVRKIMLEVGRVATAEGYPGAITDEIITRDLARPKGRLETGGKEPSMLTDVRANRPIEVEAILGNTLRLAQKHKVDTPYLELLYTLAKGRNYQLQPDERWRDISFAKVVNAT